MQTNIKMQGEYKFVINRDGVKDPIVIDFFENIITDKICDFYAYSSTAYFGSHISLGTGTTEPTKQDVSLEHILTPVISTGSTVNSLAMPTPVGPNYEKKYTYVYTMAKGKYVGNVTEVAIYPQNGSNGNVINLMLSRALIKDTNGNPITLSLTDIDQLTVYYKLNIINSKNTSTGTFTLGGNSHNYSIKCVNQDAGVGSSIVSIYEVYTNVNLILYGQDASYTPGNLTSNPSCNVSDTIYGPSSVIFGSLRCSNGVISTNIKIPINKGNFATGIKAILLDLRHAVTGLGVYQIEFDPPIVKNNTQEFSFDFNLQVN